MKGPTHKKQNDGKLLCADVYPAASINTSTFDSCVTCPRCKARLKEKR